MKRYEVYYKDDFGNVVPALDQQADDGEWVLYEDAQAEITQRRMEFRLAEEGLANYAQELQRIQQERLTWAMACECTCDACEKLSSVIRKTGSSEPQTPPHK